MGPGSPAPSWVAFSRDLHARVAIGSRFAHAIPRGGGLGFAPAQIADRRRGEWNALEYGNAVLHDALNIARLSFDNRRALRARVRGMAQESDGHSIAAVGSLPRAMDEMDKIFSEPAC